jgi:hypothetical protein
MDAQRGCRYGIDSRLGFSLGFGDNRFVFIAPSLGTFLLGEFAGGGGAVVIDIAATMEIDVVPKVVVVELSDCEFHGGFLSR